MRHARITAFAGAAALALAVGTIAVAPTVAKEMTKMVGGAAMYPSKNIVQNAIHSTRCSRRWWTRSSGWPRGAEPSCELSHAAS